MRSLTLEKKSPNVQRAEQVVWANETIGMNNGMTKCGETNRCLFVGKKGCANTTLYTYFIYIECNTTLYTYFIYIECSIVATSLHSMGSRCRCKLLDSN